MEKRSFKEKPEIIRNIIRESLLGNAAIIALIYAASHSLPVNAFPDYLVISLLSIYIYFCELFRSHWIAVWFIIWSSVINLAYFHERRSLNNFHRDRVITFEQIAE
ncbi:toxin ArtA [Escherichia coli]|uniref:toxin ArtA n=2 Tax=Escherichia coli TaxID=562 RepID=UPI000DEBE9E1|nr:toxin ArtA [Escherichia coli]RCB19588.1 toxin ArtA [Escherichia coli]